MCSVCRAGQLGGVDCKPLLGSRPVGVLGTRVAPCLQGLDSQSVREASSKWPDWTRLPCAGCSASGCRAACGTPVSTALGLRVPRRFLRWSCSHIAVWLCGLLPCGEPAAAAPAALPGGPGPCPWSWWEVPDTGRCRCCRTAGTEGVQGVKGLVSTLTRAGLLALAQRCWLDKQA